MKKSIRPFCFRDLCKIPNIFQRNLSLIQINVFFSVYETPFQILHFYNILKNGLDNSETHSTEYSIKKSQICLRSIKSKRFSSSIMFIFCAYILFNCMKWDAFAFEIFFSTLFKDTYHLYKFKFFYVVLGHLLEIYYF